MTTLRAIACGILAAASAACSGGESKPGGPAAGGTGGGTSGGSGAGGAWDAATDARIPSLPASFVAETAPGKGPALLRMTNDTAADILSVTLNDGVAYAIWAVGPKETSPWVGAATIAVIDDVIVSRHTTDGCVRITLGKYDGPSGLEPAKAYTLHVSIGSGYDGKMVEEPAPDPFVGVRVQVPDLQTSRPAPSRAVLAVPGQKALVYTGIFSTLPWGYLVVPGTSVEVSSISFIDGKGTVYGTTTPAKLAGAPGYTLVVGKSIPGAAAAVDLGKSGSTGLPVP